MVIAGLAIVGGAWWGIGWVRNGLRPDLGTQAPSPTAEEIVTSDSTPSATDAIESERPTAALAEMPTTVSPNEVTTTPTISAETAGATQITVIPAGLFDEFWAEQFDWSPDGKTVIIGGAYLYVYDVIAKTARRISTDTMGQVKVSSDGSTLVAAPYDGITLWDIATWTKLRTLTDSQGVSEIALSPDSKTVVADRNDASVFYDLATDAEPRVIATDGYVQVLAYSPDGRIVASAGAKLSLWDASAGTVLRDLEGQISVTGLAFSPDSAVLASTANDGTVRLWDVETGRPQRVLTGHTGPVRAVAFSPDGTLIATGGDDLSVRFWDAATGQQLQSVMGHTARVTRVAFSPDGNLLASGAGDGLRIWQLSVGAGAQSPVPVRATPKAPRTQVPLSPSAISPATAGTVARLGQYDTYADDFTWSPDGKTVVIGGSYFELYDIASGTGHRASTDTMGQIRFTPDGATLLSATYDGLALWDMATLTKLDTLTDSRNVRSFAVSPDGATLIAAAGDALKAWDLPSGDGLGTVPGDGYIGTLAFSPDGQTLAAGGTTLTLWDPATLVKKSTYEGQLGARDLAFSPTATCSPSHLTMARASGIWLPDARCGC